MVCAFRSAKVVYGENLRNGQIIVKLVIHPGFGKCASSSLQATLSESPIYPLDSTRKFHYLCLTSNDVLAGEQIKNRTARGVYGYTSSVNISGIHDNFQALNDLLSQRVSELPSGDIAILSCEGWCQELDKLSQIQIIKELGEECAFIFFVRAPVSWINSAFWQWGAWSDLSQEAWINNAGARGANWVNYLNKCNEHFPDAQQLVIPLTRESNVLQIFFERIGMSETSFSRLPKIRNNISLPLEILHLYLRFPELRPSPHASEIDFKMASAISDLSLGHLNRQPWAIRSSDVISLMTNLSESVRDLLNVYLDDESRALVDHEPEWIDPSAYSRREYVSVEQLKQVPVFGSLPAESLLKDFAVALYNSKGQSSKMSLRKSA